MDVFLDKRFATYFDDLPLTLVDIGARGGLPEHWRPAMKHLKTIGFEPEPDEYERLKQSAGNSVVYLNTALAEKPGEIDLHIVKSSGASSVFLPNRPFLDRFPECARFDVERTVTVPADTLDHQLTVNGIDDTDFLKIDTQGSELAILRGAHESLGCSVTGLEIEVEFAPLYADQPLFADVDEFVRQYGFQLFDLQASRWKRERGRRYGGPKGQLVFGDALYLKTPEAIRAVLAACDSDRLRRAKLLRTLSICILYGYIDYALDLFEANSDLFGPDEAELVRKSFQTSITWKNRVPNFRGRGRIAGVFHSLHHIVYPNHGGWATRDRAIGNPE